MKEIGKEYLLLFNAVTDTLNTLEELRERLMEAQRQAEELFLGEEESCNCGGQTEESVVS